MYLSKRFAALPPRRKLLARIALYGGLTVLILGAILGVDYLARPAREGKDTLVDLEKLAQEPAVQLLQDYIRIDTSTTTGSEVAGAEFLARQLAAAGLAVEIERLGDNKANLWAILEGNSPQAIVLHNHIDVYEVVDLEAWEFPPFDGVIDKAWIYGRGAFDMKSVAIAQLLAISDLAADEARPRKSVIFLASGSEEVGSDLGSKWILDTHPELVQRFETVLTEGGVVEAVSHDEIKYWGIEFAQKFFAEGEACSPSAERLEQLRADLNEISDGNFDLRLTPEVERFLRAYAESRGSSETRRILEDLGSALDHPHRFHELPAYLKSLFRDEIATFDVAPSVEGGYCMRIILHLLPGSDFDRARQNLLPDWATTGVCLSVRPPAGASFGSPIDHAAMRTLADVVREAFPAATVGPYFLPWSATDARFFRRQGIPTYGFSPFLIFATDTFRRDTLNERIDIQGYVEGVELYRRAVRRLAG